MFPYHDENTSRRTPYATYTFIALNVLAWIFIQGAGSPMAVAQAVCDLGLIPGRLTGAVPAGISFPIGPGLACVTEPGSHVMNLMSSMFLHGSWLHLLGNMWFLWLFGDNIEDSMGHGRFILFYLVSGLAAALLQVFISPQSVLPMVGASGAISGVMGAYLVLYPHVRVYAIVPIGILPLSIALPAWTMLLYWFGMQFLGGLVGMMGDERGGVAFWAHIGGFVAGMVLVKLLARQGDVQSHRAQHWEPRRVAARW